MNRIRKLAFFAFGWGLLLSAFFSPVSVEAAVDEFSGKPPVDQPSATSSHQADPLSESSRDSVSSNQGTVSESSIPAWAVWLLGAVELWLAGWVAIWSVLLAVAPGVIFNADTAMRKVAFGRYLPIVGRSLTLSRLTFAGSFARHSRVTNHWVDRHAVAITEWLAIGARPADTKEQDILVRIEGQSIAVTDASTMRAMLPETPFLLAMHGDGRSWNDQVLSILLHQTMSPERSDRMMTDRAIPVVLDRNCIERLRQSRGERLTTPLWLQLVRNELCRIPGLAESLDDNLLEHLLQSRRVLPIVDQWSRTSVALQTMLQSAVSTGELSCLVVFDDEDTVAEMSGVIRVRSQASSEFVSKLRATAIARSEVTSSAPSSIVTPAMPRVFDTVEDTVPFLIRSLEDPVADVRQSAANTLGGLGADAEVSVSGLIALLSDPVTGCRQAAVNALGAMGPSASSAVSLVAYAAQNDHRAVRAAACRALGVIGRSDVTTTNALTHSLLDPDSKVRTQAARSLGCIRAADMDSVAGLVAALRDSVPEVRRNAVAALNAIGVSDAETVSAIEKATRDEDDRVRQIAQVALSRVIQSPVAA